MLIHRDDGFSMVELLIAMVLLGIFLIPLTTVFSQSIRYVRAAKKRDVATRLMTSCLSEVRSVADYSSELTPGNAVQCNGNSWSGGTFQSFDAPYSRIEYQTLVRQVANDSGRNVKKIHIKVRYKSPISGDRRCLRDANCGRWDSSTFVSKR